MKRYGLTLELKDDPELIAAYKAHHTEVWPEVVRSIYEADIVSMEIYCVGTRLFMLMEVGDAFSFEKKRERDASNSKVQEWESLMDRFQQRLSLATEDEKWVLMERIFDLKDYAASGQVY